MSEKIILTVEQDEAIKKMIKDKFNVNHFSIYEGRFNTKYNSLNNLTVDQFARILYEPNSYEVEKPPFAVGDWVAYISSNRVFKVMNVQGTIVTEDDNISTISEVLRHATEEEIFWAELGREFGEFKVGDVVIENTDTSFHIGGEFGGIYSELKIAKEYYDKNKLKGIYPKESFKPFPTGTTP